MAAWRLTLSRWVIAKTGSAFNSPVTIFLLTTLLARCAGLYKLRISWHAGQPHTGYESLTADDISMQALLPSPRGGRFVNGDVTPTPYMELYVHCFFT